MVSIRPAHDQSPSSPRIPQGRSSIVPAADSLGHAICPMIRTSPRRDRAFPAIASAYPLQR